MTDNWYIRNEDLLTVTEVMPTNPANSFWSCCGCIHLDNEYRCAGLTRQTCSQWEINTMQGVHTSQQAMINPLFLPEFMFFIESRIMRPSLLRGLNFQNSVLWRLWFPRWLTKQKQKIGRKSLLLCWTSLCIPVANRRRGCCLQFRVPRSVCHTKGNVCYSCNMLRAVDSNCFPKCEDNCDIWKRQESCTNKLCSAADLVHTVLCRLLQNFASTWGVGKERKDLRHALPSQRSDPDDCYLGAVSTEAYVLSYKILP